MPRPITQCGEQWRSACETTADVRLGGTRRAARRPYTVGRSTLPDGRNSSRRSRGLELRAVLLMQRELCDGGAIQQVLLICILAAECRSFCARSAYGKNACLCCVEGTCGEMGPLVGVWSGWPGGDCPTMWHAKLLSRRRWRFLCEMLTCCFSCNFLLYHWTHWVYHE